jgi:O-antigen/teichoic acid export membrane protein
MSISKNIGVTYISQIGGVFISVLSTIFLSRILGAEGRGEFSVYNNSVTFFNLFIGLSLPSTIIYSVANKRVDENKLLSTLLLYTLVSTVFVILVLQTFFYFNIQSMIFAKDKETMVWKAIFVLHFLSVTFNNLLIAFLNAKRKFMLSSAIGIVNVLIPLLGYLLIYFHLLPMHQRRQSNLRVAPSLPLQILSLRLHTLTLRQNLLRALKRQRILQHYQIPRSYR